MWNFLYFNCRGMRLNIQPKKTSTESQISVKYTYIIISNYEPTGRWEANIIRRISITARVSLLFVQIDIFQQQS